MSSRGLRAWSTTPGSNATVGSINWAEGQAPSTVNDSARQTMADVADWFSNPAPEWVGFDSATYASATTFTVPGNRTGIYTTGRRVYANVTAGTILGTVTNAVYGTLTTVTVAWDGTQLDSGLSLLKAGIVSGAGSFPVGDAFNMSQLSVSASAQTGLFLNAGPTGSCYMKFSCSGGAKFSGVTGNSWVVVNQANSTVLLSCDDSGNFTATANVTAYSDERLKDNWQDLPDEIIELAALCEKVGTFDRLDIPGDEHDNNRYVGVGAQSWLKIMPEAVFSHESGKLSVAYGNAALALCVKLCQRVVALQKRIEELESK